ncbi:type II secretion system protein [Sulfurimonas sp.]|uniref:type II secretion system protein n=1 Tax=Sulfurimonas sp. TaxID=2022749 RepID=UPI002B473D26|nr:type II secretion system protein [Sulfurimonas sp.]
MVRYAFTLIELIFAIVIISISVMSLPMISQITFKTISNSQVQEAIFASVAGLNEATTYRWDEFSMNDAQTATFDPQFARVVNVVVGGNNDCSAATPNKRKGHINRKCLNDLSTRPYIGTVFNDSLNVAAHPQEHIFILDANSSAEGYKKLYDSILVVESNATFNKYDPNNPNLKEITITILDKNTTNIVTVLRTYSANIGEVSYARRSYP